MSEPSLSEPRRSALGRLGKFDLLRELGRGGMGVVYEAFDTALKRPCAVKVMLSTSGSDLAPALQEQERFLREARLCATLLKHPAIVQVYEAGAAGGKHFFAMELVRGWNLARWRREPGVTVRRQVELLRRVLAAVQYAHERGVIHRDLKPENILVDDQDRPHLVDFGLAKTVEGPSLSLTASGALMGTPNYMSPEQARNSKSVDARTDVWAAGVMLYEILAGRLPFVADTPVDLLMKIAKELAPTPSSLLPPGAPRDWDEALERICLKALAKDPGNRYATAGDFGADLSGWLEGKEVAAAPPRRFTVYRFRKSHVLAVAGAAAALVLLLGALVLRPSRAREVLQAKDRELQRQEEELRQRDQELRRVAEEKARVEASRLASEEQRDEEKKLSESALRVAQIELQLREIELRRKAGEELKPIEPLPWIQASERPPKATLTGHTNDIQAVRFSPDGKSLASCASDSTVRRWSVESGTQEFAMTRHATLVRAVDFSPDGTRLVSVDYDGKMFLSDARTGNEIRSFARQERYLEGVSFTPDGRTLATACRDGKVRLWDAESGEERAAFDCGSRVLAIAVSRDGRWLAAGMDTGAVRVWSLPERVEIPMGPGPAGWIRNLAFDSSGERLLAAGNYPVPTLWSVKSRKVERPLTGHATAAAVGAMSPDGRVAATGSADALVKLWDVSTGFEIRSLTGLACVVGGVAFSPDGKLLAVGGSNRLIRLWSVEELLRP